MTGKTAILLAATCALIGAHGIAADRPDYNRDIRPILSDNCYACHGPDDNKRKAGLRLDLPESARAALKSGNKAIVPGDPGTSELIRRLTTDDADERMPPAESGKSLTPQQVELIRRWIDAGAEWQPHWAYNPLSRSGPPEVTDPGFVRNEIDRFILARLKAEGLSPSPAADRTTLLRRLSFDITGLLPSPRHRALLANSKSPSGYEALVDRLLGSPEFGERMAMYWLDLVRYADTCGYHGDQHVDVTLYRDYVVRSFNQNKPFDQFTIEQLAGDLLPDATKEQKIASGYNRLLQTTEEGGSQPKEYRAKYAADRVRNASTVWMGATMGCAECHDHKFDPYTTRDFYSFAAFFADIQEKAVGRQDPVKFPSNEETETLKALEERIKPLKEEMNIQTPELDTAQARWESRQWQWDLLLPEEVVSENGTLLELRDDETILASGDRPKKEVYTVNLQTDLEGITAFRLEVLPDPSLPENGPGRWDNGNFVLTEFEVKSGDKAIGLHRAVATFAQDKHPASNAIDNKNDTGWGVEKKNGQPNYALFETKEPLGDGSPLNLTFVLRHEGSDHHHIGRFRLYASTTEPPTGDDGPQPPPVDILKILETAASERSEEQQQSLSGHYRGFSRLLDRTRKEIETLQKQIDTINNEMAKTLITVSVNPREMRVLPRGNWLSDDGDVVQPAIPEFLGKLSLKEDQRATRLDLAKWFTQKDNPLVARVFVNRLWKLMFGRGIVKSLDDFGSQGTTPHHPDLLDWLAYEFIESGWDVKHMVKLIAMSGTYRQSSALSPELMERDPQNNLFARQGRFRLDAEMIRDNALLVSALLARDHDGRSVKPYQPVGYWSHLNFPKREYKNDKGDDLYRRGVYTYWCRTFLHPSLAAFDAPTREECTVERVRSNTPQQALVLLNDPTYVEAARVFAELMIRGGGKGPRGKIRYAFQRALTRKPTSEEYTLLTGLYRKHLKEYREDPKSAKALIGVGDWPLLKDIDRAELAAWTSVSRVVLNLHETITRR